MQLSSEKEHLVLKNKNLIYYTLKKMGISRKSSDYEDLVSIGEIGLMKAAIVFDEQQNRQFSTYAFKCIRNEILIFYGKNDNKPNRNISLNAIVTEKNNLTLENKLKDPNSNFPEKIIDKEVFILAVNIILNCLNSKEKLTILYYLGNMKQSEIARKMHCSKSQISKRIHRIPGIIRQLFYHPEPYKKIFSMEVQGDYYQISFLWNDMNQFRKIISTTLADVSSNETPDWKVLYNEERIAIRLEACPESFILIARMIQEIEKYGFPDKKDSNE